MSEIEKMQQYIKRTKMDTPVGYSMSMIEGLELAKQASNLPLEAIDLAFEYGRAKGYCAAKAEARRG